MSKRDKSEAVESLGAGLCENYEDDGTHYRYGHWVKAGADTCILCTKCCDRAKAQGLVVRFATTEEIAAHEG